MEDSDIENDRQDRRQPTILAGYLASALNMEDEIISGVYLDYLSPKNWPEQIDPEVFQKIKDRLTVLINDTRRHKKIIAALARSQSQDQ